MRKAVMAFLAGVLSATNMPGQADAAENAETVRPHAYYRHQNFRPLAAALTSAAIDDTAPDALRSNTSRDQMLAAVDVEDTFCARHGHTLCLLTFGAGIIAIGLSSSFYHAQAKYTLLPFCLLFGGIFVGKGLAELTCRRQGDSQD